MFRRRRSVEDFAEEIKAHLDLETDELMREGQSLEEARRRARIEFGNVQAARERFYLKSRVGWLENLARDIRFAIRQLVSNPGFAVTAILVLALGIGAGVAIFAFVDAALLEPLPYANSSRLVSVNESTVEMPRWPLSYPDYLDWQRLNKSFSSLSVYSGTAFLMRTSAGTESVRAARVSGNFFLTLGVRPILGRDFYPGEGRPGGPNVALLSYGAWLHRFGGRKNVLGEAINLDNKASATSYTIIGVLPREFSFAPSGNAELWIPINVLSPHEQTRIFYNFWGVGRLRDGVGIQTAQAEMTAIAKELQQQYAISGRNLTSSVVPLTEIVIGDVRPILLTLLSGAGLLLLIACVNVAGLVLVRSESRRREIAVRGALGATRARLMRQLVTEGFLLAALGSAAGLVIASALTRLLGSFVPKDLAARMPFLESVGLNPHTTAFAVLTFLMAALLMAAVPALRLLFQKARDGLVDGDRGAASRLWQRLGANLVVVELAVAVVLLVGAGLLGQSLYRLLHVSLGLDPNHLATMRVMAPGSVYTSNDQTIALYREIERRISKLPGVVSAGMSSLLPVVCNCSIDRIHFRGRPYHGEHNDVDERHVSPEYLSTLKATLLRGRFFIEADDASKPGVAVINQALARKHFPGEDPIGQKIENDEGGRPSEWEIVGVVDNVREGPLDVATWPAEYLPLNQTRDLSFSLVVRTGQDAEAMLAELESTLHQIDPSLAVSDEATMTERINSSEAALLHRFAAWLVGGFAATALVLGVVGLYGVIAYAVSRRTREIGVRMALGAQPSSVYRLIIGQAGRLTATGLAFGLACSVGSSMLVRKLLFGVQAWDIATLIGVAVLLSLASVAASFLPARRAALVNPVEALRAE